MDSKYIPKDVVPTKAQMEFLKNNDKFVRFKEDFEVNPHISEKVLPQSLPLKMKGQECGVGRTFALLIDCVLHCERHPMRCLILTRQFSQLTLPGGVQCTLNEWFNGTEVKWNSRERTFTFPNGSIIQLDFCQDIVDFNKFLGR